MIWIAVVMTVVAAEEVRSDVAEGRHDGSPIAAERDAERVILADFDGSDPRRDTRSGVWRTVNDNIMGGRSTGGGTITGGAMIFRGSTNTNGGGFSSVRAGDKRWDLGTFDGVAARVRADGRRYVFHIQTGLRYDNGTVAYRGSFDTKRLIDTDGRPVDADDADKTAASDERWQEVFVSFADFVPMVRGRAVTGRVPALEPAKVRSIGLMIDDGRDGPFRLEVDWLAAVSKADSADE
jgi:NADH dehydrogenase [ubiquinone] 1 alpha subcomplex assembly factor 1